MPRRTTVGLLIAIVVVTGLLFSTSFNAGGAGMDEGTLVTYPELVLHGDVPGRDFETFYGPGGPYLVAGAFSVFGHSVATERAIGLTFKLAIVAALFVLLLPWGRFAAAAGSLASALLMLPLGVSAVDWFGALGFALLGLAALAAVARREEEGGGTLVAAGGIACGLGIVFRVDLAPAVILASLPLWFSLSRENRIRYLVGLLIGAVPAIVWLAVIGPHGVKRLLDDLSASRSARSLPIPSPVHTAWGQALVVSILALAATAGTLAWRRWKSAWGFADKLLLSLGLFTLAILPSALERADDEHILAVACVAVVLIPAVAATLWPSLRGGRPLGLARGSALAGVGLLVLIGAATVVHVIGVGPTVKSNILGISEPEDESFKVENDGRSFPSESEEVADGLNELLPKLDAIAPAGSSVFVGPQDLSRTEYADTYLYFLLPHLKPASFYLELNPGSANSDDSGLAEELEEADFLLLTSHYETAEGETAPERGSRAPERVVDEEFCEIDSAGSYKLYRRCDLPPAQGAGNS